MLDRGEIDALIGAREPNSFRKKSPNVTRLFPNYREVETKYYQRTGIFPIMHLIVLKRRIYEECPWLAYSLYKAFMESKEICTQEMSMQSALRYMLPWMIPELEETTRIMGEDYWPYGVNANRKTLEAFIGYSEEQGLIESPFKLEDLFAPETINVAKI
jgi:4,5-dihydroxyphthalate decarboxylase